MSSASRRNASTSAASRLKYFARSPSRQGSGSAARAAAISRLPRRLGVVREPVDYRPVVEIGGQLDGRRPRRDPRPGLLPLGRDQIEPGCEEGGAITRNGPLRVTWSGESAMDPLQRLQQLPVDQHPAGVFLDVGPPSLDLGPNRGDPIAEQGVGFARLHQVTRPIHLGQRHGPFRQVVPGRAGLALVPDRLVERLVDRPCRRGEPPGACCCIHE